MRNNTRLALGGILLIAFILRVIGIRFGLPHLYHQDEPIVVNHAMAIGAGGWNTGVYWPPQFASYFLFLFYAVSFITGHLFGFFKNAEAFGTWFVKDPTYFYLLGRLVLGVGFGTATVWVMWRLGKDYFSQKTGLLTALFLAVCYVHVQHSHYIYVDIPLGFALALLFCAWLSLLKGFSIQKAFWVGLAFGWAVSVKYTAFYFAPVFLVLHILVFGKDLFSRRSFLGWLVEGAAALGIYALISPFTFLDWPAFIAEASSQSGARGYSGWLYHTVYSIIPGTSPLLFILAVLGLVYSFWNYRKEAVLLGSAALVYYLVNVYFTQPFARYMMPLILLVCLWAALGCLWAVSLIKKPMVKSMIIAATLLSTLVPSIYSDFLFLRKDTRTQCLEWIESRVPEGSVIVVDNLFYSPPLRQTREQIEEKYRSLGDQRGSGAKRTRLSLELKALEGKKTYNRYTLTAQGEQMEQPFLFMKPFIGTNWNDFKEKHADYFIINYSDYIEANHVFKESIVRHLERVAVFSPYQDASRKVSKDPYASTAAPHMLSELFSRNRLGPYIEVYKVKD